MTSYARIRLEQETRYLQTEEYLREQLKYSEKVRIATSCHRRPDKTNSNIRQMVHRSIQDVSLVWLWQQWFCKMCLPVRNGECNRWCQVYLMSCFPDLQTMMHNMFLTGWSNSSYIMLEPASKQNQSEQAVSIKLKDFLSLYTFKAGLLSTWTRIINVDWSMCKPSRYKHNK
jgi:hypothetical protein